jgi:hypothetical protein
MQADNAARRPRPVRSGRQFVAVGRKRGAAAAIGQPTTLAAAQSEADSLRMRDFHSFAVYELVEVKS